MALKFLKQSFYNLANIFFIFACSSSANTIMLGARMIKHGLLDRAIVGGVDSLTKFTVNGFNVLQILSTGYINVF